MRARSLDAEALKNPLAGLYVTHYHPDHLLGAAAFDAPARQPIEIGKGTTFTLELPM
jgi:glyoxylase-like metal-dependent hydrolase (beta-lactamase superfamily II)